jgi:cell wall-associated NlpC family hydrolase
VLIGIALSLAACGSNPPKREAVGIGSGHRQAPTGVQGNPAHDVLFLAISLVGTPYRYGGNTPDSGFDCSGLIGYVFRQAASLALPRTTRELRSMRARDVKRSELSSGDLVFFGSRGRVDHAGIYVGEGRFVHAPSSGGTVRLDAVDGPYWKERFLGGKRLLPGRG